MTSGPRTLSLLGAAGVIVGLSRPPNAMACDCISDTRVVVPPKLLPNGALFEAPTNTQAWVFEYVIVPRQPALVEYNVRLQGSTVPLGKARRRPITNGIPDPSLDFQVRVVEIALPELAPQRAYEVFYTDRDASVHVVSTFHTGQARDVHSPSFDGDLRCELKNGHRSAESICVLGHPSAIVWGAAHDVDTPSYMLLARATSIAASLPVPQNADDASLVGWGMGGMELTATNLCIGREFWLPEPLEPGTIEIELMDLAGHVSVPKRCAILGPHTDESMHVAARLRAAGIVPEAPALRPTHETATHAVSNALTTVDTLVFVILGALAALGVSRLTETAQSKRMPPRTLRP